MATAHATGQRLPARKCMCTGPRKRAQWPGSYGLRRTRLAAQCFSTLLAHQVGVPVMAESLAGQTRVLCKACRVTSRAISMCSRVIGHVGTGTHGMADACQISKCHLNQSAVQDVGDRLMAKPFQGRKRHASGTSNDLTSSPLLACIL